MARLSVYVSDELEAVIRRELPDVNVSAVLQRGLSELLGCEHRRAVCAECSSPIDMEHARDVALGSFYSDLLYRLEELVARGATAEGAARVAKDVALRHRVTVAKTLALPRPSRAQYAQHRVTELDNANGRPRPRSVNRPTANTLITPKEQTA